MSEDIRVGAQVARRCACRGWIIAPEMPGKAVAERVEQHQLDEPHKTWALADWQERNTAQVEVRIVKR